MSWEQTKIIYVIVIITTTALFIRVELSPGRAGRCGKHRCGAFSATVRCFYVFDCCLGDIFEFCVAAPACIITISLEPQHETFRDLSCLVLNDDALSDAYTCKWKVQDECDVRVLSAAIVIARLAKDENCGAPSFLL